MVKGNIEMTMDATPWFRSKDKSDNLGVLSGPRKTGLAELVPTVRSLQITQATEVCIHEKNRCHSSLYPRSTWRPVKHFHFRD